MICLDLVLRSYLLGLYTYSNFVIAHVLNLYVLQLLEHNYVLLCCIKLGHNLIAVLLVTVLLATLLSQQGSSCLPYQSIIRRYTSMIKLVAIIYLHSKQQQLSINHNFYKRWKFVELKIWIIVNWCCQLFHPNLMLMICHHVHI